MPNAYSPFPVMDAPQVDYQQVDGQSVPRCSLDFRIYLESGTIGDSQLRLQSFQGQDQLSQPFEYQLELRANDFTAGSANPEFIGNQIQEVNSQSQQQYGELLSTAYPATQQLNFDLLMGANATILLGTPETDNDVADGQYPSTRPVVFFNGIISNFAFAQRGVYHATLKPALFKLTLQNNYRVFSNKTILEVVTQVLDDNNIKYNKAELESSQSSIVCGLATYRKQDWLQAGESDFDFITRLMTKVNLFYYFVHDEFSHTMVITDQPYYKTIYKREINEQGFNVETDQIKPLFLSFTKQASADRDDYIESFRFQQNLTTSGVTTILAQKESVWESQNTAQASPIFQQRQYQQEKLNMAHMHTVQYGASWEEVDKMTNTAMNKINAGRFNFSGNSGSPELKAGHKFVVQETYKQSPSTGFSSPLPIRPELNNQEFVVTSVQHQAKAEGDYSNQFSAVGASGLATPDNPHSVSQGSILARVTQKPPSVVSSSFSSDSEDNDSDEIDHTGSAAKQLEKTVFTFDSNQFQYQIDQSQDQFSCTGVYVRFIDQPEDAPAVWVKIAEHMQTVPEVGVYVTVSRSGDDNEIPEIQQIVQAKGSKVIMPQGYTTNTNVGDSYNTSYGDSTSIGFGADITTPLTTAQNIVNSQRDTGNYNDVRYGESSSYSYNVTSHSHNISLTGTGTPPAFDPADMMNYVSYGHSVTNGDVYSQSEMTGNSTHSSTTTGNTTSSSVTNGNSDSSSVTNGNNSSSSTHNGNIDSSNSHEGMNNSSSTHSGMQNSASNMNGMINSASNTNGMRSSADNFNGVTNSVNVMLGMDNSASTRTGMFNSASNITGMQLSAHSVIGSSISTSSTIGNSTSTNTVVGNNTSTNTTTGNVTNTNTIIGNSTSSSVVTGIETINGVVAGTTNNNKTVAVENVNETVASRNGNSTVASKANIDTTATDNSVLSTQSDNTLTSKTAQNVVSNVSAGTTTSNDSSLITENKMQHTEIVGATKIIL